MKCPICDSREQVECIVRQSLIAKNGSDKVGVTICRTCFNKITKTLNGLRT